MGAKADRIASLEAEIDRLDKRIAQLTQMASDLHERVQALEAKASQPGVRQQVTEPIRRWLDDLSTAVGL